MGKSLQVYRLLLLQLKEQNIDDLEKDGRQLKKFIKMWLFPNSISEISHSLKNARGRNQNRTQILIPE